VSTTPNFLHIGPGKAGSTWVHETLSRHPEVHLTEAKDLYFFSRFYDQGIDWYAHHFKDAPSGARVVGEVCPEYLWFPQAAERVRASLGPDVRIMTTLRDPVTRAFSAYLYQRKNGMTGRTFAQALDASPEIIDQGRYRTHLERFLQELGREALHVTLFDDLKADPQAFVDDATKWLGLSQYVLPAESLAPQLPASRPRSAAAARWAKAGAAWVRRHDGAQLVGRVKRSPLVNRALYEPLGDRAPQVPAAEADRIREELAGEVAGTEALFGLSLMTRWGWQ
jgi:hypothetical protein